MLLNCTENKGNKLIIEEDCNGQLVIQITSKEMMCELVVVLSEEDTAKIKKLESTNEVKKTYDLIDKAEHRFGENSDEVVEVCHEMAQVMEDISSIKTRLKLMLNKPECEHDFVSADNEVVTGGEVCTKCHAVQAVKS